CSIGLCHRHGCHANHDRQSANTQNTSTTTIETFHEAPPEVDSSLPSRFAEPMSELHFGQGQVHRMYESRFDKPYPCCPPPPTLFRPAGPPESSRTTCRDVGIGADDWCRCRRRPRLAAGAAAIVAGDR